MIINRVFARANHWTFEIKPVRELIDRYVGTKSDNGWIDPFAGQSKIAEFRNDMNPALNQPNRLEAISFVYECYQLNRLFEGALFDPPFSHRQVSDHYKIMGMKASALDTSANFTIKVKRALAPIIKPGGYAITCGWNTAGFGKTLGFEIVEILMVNHGLTHNDTLVTVERKKDAEIETPSTGIAPC